MPLQSAASRAGYSGSGNGRSGPVVFELTGVLTMLRKLIASAMALAMAAAVMTAAPETAEARRGGSAIAAGIVAGAILGAYAYGSGAYASPYYYSYSYGSHSYAPHCYKGPRQCNWVGRSCWHDRYGDPVCRGGEWRCWRPTICD